MHTGVLSLLHPAFPDKNSARKMPMKTLFALALAALLLAWHPQARAIACGDTVATDVTLAADLHCSSGWVALYVPTSGVTIRLNGHTLSGTSALQGIQVLNASRVTIIGPGRITGFWVGVNSTRADYLEVRDLEFDSMGAGVIASDTLAATVSNNEFHNLAGSAMSILAFPGSRPTLGAHAVLDNLVLESGGGITICGHPNSDNLVRGNTLQGIRDYGIHVSDASNHNQITGNQLLKTGLAGIVLRGTRNNQVSGNLVDYGEAGMTLVPEFTAGCSTGPYTDPSVRENSIQGNSIFRHRTAVNAGLGGSGFGVLKNRITGNKFYYNNTGLYLQADTYANDATGNAYYRTTTPVVDFGRSNRY